MTVRQANDLLESQIEEIVQLRKALRLRLWYFPEHSTDCAGAIGGECTCGVALGTTLLEEKK